jgi:hypothetical protein
MSLVDLGREKDSLVAVDGLECVSAVCPTGCSTSLAILGNECLLRKQGATDEDQILGEFIQGVLTGHIVKSPSNNESPDVKRDLY